MMVEGSPLPFMVNVIMGKRFAGIKKIKAVMTSAQVRVRLLGMPLVNGCPAAGACQILVGLCLRIAEQFVTILAEHHARFFSG